MSLSKLARPAIADGFPVCNTDFGETQGKHIVSPGI